MLHAEISVPRLHLSENETARPENSAECATAKPFLRNSRYLCPSVLLSIRMYICNPLSVT